jgi:hypothetical protein
MTSANESVSYAHLVVRNNASVIWKWLSNLSQDTLAIFPGIRLRKSYDEYGLWFRYVLVDYGFGYEVMEFKTILQLAAPEQFDISAVMETEENVFDILDWVQNDEVLFLELSDNRTCLVKDGDTVIVMYAFGILCTLSVADVWEAAMESASMYSLVPSLLDSVYSSDDIVPDAYLMSC